MMWQQQQLRSAQLWPFVTPVSSFILIFIY